DMFFAVAERLSQRPFLWARREGAWHAQSWAEAASEVRALAQGLGDLGVRDGDRVALVAENRPEWATADVAIMAARAIAVPAYIPNTVADHRHILTDSGARIAIVSTRRLAEAVLAAARHAPSVEAVVVMEADATEDGPPRVLPWKQVLAGGLRKARIGA